MKTLSIFVFLTNDINNAWERMTILGLGPRTGVLDSKNYHYPNLSGTNLNLFYQPAKIVLTNIGAERIVARWQMQVLRCVLASLYNRLCPSVCLLVGNALVKITESFVFKLVLASL